MWASHKLGIKNKYSFVKQDEVPLSLKKLILKVSEFI